MLGRDLLVLLTVVCFVEFSTAVTDTCYQCNSALEPDCASSDLTLLKKFIKKCDPDAEIPQKSGSTPVACRKIIQQVDPTPERIIRECSYTLVHGSPQVNGMRKQGNKGIKMFYYQCENADNVSCCFFTLLCFRKHHFSKFIRWN
ncbi:unnamed protein product [Enterobius vermicularis]|uniref:Protein quiver n=1 Tax=Enterobius vermicularis TaxID=51028 RepID=A0A0N4UWL8_ENTVE|nr:unnamed protein product [Enterobius vermicularis]